MKANKNIIKRFSESILSKIYMVITFICISLNCAYADEPDLKADYKTLGLTANQINAVPVNYLYYHADVIDTIKTTWEDMPIPSVFPALMEQETCRHLKHPQCFSRFAELKTSREYGFGLGQLTVTSKFNTFNEVKLLDARLKTWQWEDRYNAKNQMISALVMLKRNYGIFKYATDPVERMAFSTASYNGGIGGIQADQRVCRNTKGCDEWKWFGNVENTSLKAKTAMQGYGKSFFETNREHTRNILKLRRNKYKPFVDPYFLNVRF